MIILKSTFGDEEDSLEQDEEQAINDGKIIFE